MSFNQWVYTLVVMSVCRSGEGQVLLFEGFESSDQFTGAEHFFSDGAEDYLGLSGGSFGGGSPPDVKDYSGFDGSFLTGQDLDGEGLSLPVELTWEAIDVTGLSQLRFRGRFAEFFDSPGDIDASDFIAVSYRVDGGSFQDLIRFSGVDYSSGTSNGLFGLDEDFDGFGEGARLDGNAATFESLLSVDGEALDLRLALSLSSGDEDIAVDDFELTAVPEPRQTSILAAVAILAFVVMRRVRHGRAVEPTSERMPSVS